MGHTGTFSIGIHISLHFVLLLRFTLVKRKLFKDYAGKKSTVDEMKLASWFSPNLLTDLNTVGFSANVTPERRGPTLNIRRKQENIEAFIKEE